ncbi:MAG: 1,2-phenylacetyl-CoA epoxidase subunit PaaD [Pseudomonadota bacterium]
MALEAKPTCDDVWRWLEDVPDPEIPVVSVVDLGIVRAVEWLGDELVVTVTPTYSGCPATAVISMEVEEALRRKNLDRVRVESRLSPAWTTAWITDEAREKLKAYGIAPPVDGVGCAGALKAQGPVVCPRCGAAATERVSAFGSTPCKAHYRCKECLEPFDYFKTF